MAERLLVVVLLLVAVACSAPPAAPTATPTCEAPPPASPAPETALSRFAAACRFLPSDMQSYWFTDHRLEREHAPDETALVTVLAGRDFLAPQQFGTGDFTWVSVRDFGVDGATGELRHTVQIDGHEVWVELGFPDARGHRRDRWLTRVENRFEVAAPSRELLKAALACSSRLDDLLAFAPDLAQAPRDAPELMFCKPRAPGDPMFSCPPPTAAMMVAYTPAIRRVQILSREPQGAIGAEFRSSSSSRCGAWHCLTFDECDWLTAGVVMDSLFGLQMML